MIRSALRALARLRVLGWALLPLLAGCSASMVHINPPADDTTVIVTVVAAGTGDPLTVDATVVVGGQEATLEAGDDSVRIADVPLGNADPPTQPLTVNAAGFATYFENLELQTSGTTTVQVELDAADPNTTGTLTGTVTDVETGQPVANAVLTFTPDIGGSPEGVQTATNQAGKYTARGVYTGATLAEVVASGYLTGEGSVVVIQDSGGGNTDPVDFKLVPNSATVTVHGRVVDLISREGIEGASVTIGGVGPATTDADGAFTLTDVPVGDQVVEVMADKYDTLSSSLEVLPSMAAPVFELAPIQDEPPPGPATIRGTVTIHNNADNAGATVEATRTSDGKVIDTDVTNTDGEYGLFVPPGRYRIEVSFKGVKVSRVVTLDGFGRVLTGIDFEITAP